MQHVKVVVLGGGVAGLSSALFLAREGHSVVICERDNFTDGVARSALEWPRKGVAHFLQPHAFMPCGRKVLRDRLPDVFDALLAAGAQDVDMRKKLPGTAIAQDADLQYLAVRRPIIEWALRRAVATESRIEVRSGIEVTGLRLDGNDVIGVDVGAAEVESSLVVDAMGRRTRTGDWLAQHSIEETPPESSDCGVVYYSRYYQLHNDFELPDGHWILGPRGDLGYMGYATFPGDNRTFAALLAVPPGRTSSRDLKEPAVFEAVMAQIPAMRQWVNPEGVTPITEVLTMAGLRNTFRCDQSEIATGLVRVGDSRCHSDPVLALGISFALLHSFEMSEAVGGQSNLGDAIASYHDQTQSFVRERFDFATELDDQRLRMWNGEAVDFASRDGAKALFSIVAGGVASLEDPEVFRVLGRRNGLLDSLIVLDHDEAMKKRIEDIFRAAAQVQRPPAGPTLSEMETIIADNVAAAT